jgi:hypothetical protein
MQTSIAEDGEAAEVKMFCMQAPFTRQEIKMSVSIKAPMALGFLLAIPLFALPALGAPAHVGGSRPAHYRVADFAKATALVKTAAPVAEDHRTDGLSRNDEDCSRGGCIDH